MTIEPIGIIHSPYNSKVDCPIQLLYAAEGGVSCAAR